MTRILLTSYLLALIACGGEENSSNLTNSGNDGDLNTTEQPLFPNSVVSNNLDFIREYDQGPEGVLNYDGTLRQEMPDKRNNILNADNVYTFRAVYEDDSSVGIWVHPDIGSKDQATKIATKIINPVGKLHTSMRSKLDHIVIHNGDETAFAEKDAHFFVLYSNNIATRIANNDLEETVFHEAVHATLDKQHAESEAWKTAVTKDNAYITDYAANNTKKEDLAESALFAWAVIIHPNRLSASIEERVKALIPHRINFFKQIFLPNE
jgi:hypothetical protein